MRILSIGAGMERIDGAVHLDRVSLPGIDIVWDIERTPWPMGTGCWDKVVANDVLEHVNNIIGVVDEINRVLKVGGVLEAQVPQWGTINTAIDPTHVRAFTELTFDYWCPATELGDKYWWYTNTAFKKVSCRVQEQNELVFVLAKLGDKRAKGMDIYAKGIRKDAGQVHPWGDEQERGPDQGGKDLERKPQDQGRQGKKVADV